MEAYSVFKDLAIILVFAKFFGILARKYKAPQVVGEIIAGLVIGPCVLQWVSQTEFLMEMAELGVVLIMFSAGLETNLKDLLKTGPIAFVIACAGVFIPLVGGSLFYMSFYGFSPWGSPDFYKAVFIGVIMTATSVSITVETLKELGHLKGRIGTTILSAAVIDDVIGIIVLTFVIGLTTPSVSASDVLVNTLLFCLFIVVVGFLAYKIFKVVDAKYPHTRRIPIAGLAFCLALAYIAEKYFGIADITGAYAAGIILCSIRDSQYIATKMDVNSYMLFGPVFFASIGLKTNISGLDTNLLLFSAGFVVVALATKIIGCGLCAKLFKFNNYDALKVGVGMMTRGEVALIVSQKGLSCGIISSVYFSSVILLIITSSITTPIVMKMLYDRTDKLEAAEKIRHVI